MSDQKFDVFVSYDRRDGEFVAALLSRLGAENIHAFADRSIKPGDEWLPRLESALKESKVILFLITPNSLESNWVNVEAGAAWILRKTLLPVVRDVEPSELIDFMRSRQVHDLTKGKEFHDLVAILRQHVKPQPSVQDKTNRSEFFNTPAHWQKLLRIGDWSHEKRTEVIVGTGMFTYLLSRHEHGPNFSITSRFAITNAHPESSLNAINAGIVLGWTTPTDECRYYNLLLTGERMLLELVGGEGGDAYVDYNHVDREGVEFKLSEDTEYTFSIKVRGCELQVLVRGEHGMTEYETQLPEPLHGRVGMRPWRSTMVCNQFNVVSE